MSATASAVPVISLSEGFGAVVVQGDKIRVEISPEGHINVRTPGRVTNSAATNVSALDVGAIMPDGSIYAGVSLDTGKPMFATPKDAPRICTFNEAEEYASELDAHGRQDWRVPTRSELKVLFQNRAAIGGFDETGHIDTGCYWSSSGYFFNLGAWVQRFSDGRQGDFIRSATAALRCVRG
jgi:hypothetical protein